MTRRWLFPSLTATLLVASASPCFAEAAKTADTAVDAYSYDFETDFLDGDDLKGDGPRLVVRPGSLRVLLIRPRTSFTVELIKSTETF